MIAIFLCLIVCRFVFVELRSENELVAKTYTSRMLGQRCGWVRMDGIYGRWKGRNE